jgi:immune inhibitor A
MYKKLIPIAVAALMLVVLFYPVQHADAAIAKLPDYRPYDAGPEIRSWEPSEGRLDLSINGETGSGAAATPTLVTLTILDTKIWLILNDYTGQYQATYFNKVAVGPTAEIWVQQNLAWPVGDPRVNPVVTQAQIDYLLGQYENVIRSQMTDYFRAPDYHGGENALFPSLVPPSWGITPDYYEGDKFVILVSNVRDDNYYDPSYPNYIAGFYSPTFELYFDRNIISIDAYDWANRIGPGVSRPYLYEGIIAHEMEHLLMGDSDPDEETFVNEGLADFSIPLCGYGSPISHTGDLVTHPENSLVAWEDQGGLEVLADYGLVYMWTLFLYEKFGTTMIKKMFNDPKNGISGINSALASYGTPRRFADLYRDFSVALLIDWSMNNYQYGFKGENFKIDIGTPAAPNPEAFATPGAPAWGTDYIWLQKNAKQVVFDGADTNARDTKWTTDAGWLWSGTGDLLDNWAIFEAQGGGTLTFDTIWDLEDYWDFGFVQVSTDGGHTWTSLANAYTTTDYDPNAHPKVIENLPGLTSWVAAPVTMSFDLSTYAGQDILIGFRMVTDWGTHYGGWWIDNVYVDGALISDGTDASVFMDITEVVPIENDFMITLVGFRTTMFGTTYTIIKVMVNDMNEMAGILMSSVAMYSKVAMLITYCAPEGLTDYAPYTLTVKM